MKFDSVIVIGMGGTGSNLMPLLSRYLYSIKYDGNIILVDGDSYSDSNVNRQIFSQEAGLQVNKAEYQGLVIQSHLPALAEQVMISDKYLSKEDVDELVTERSLVINCADNSAIRKYVEDRVAILDDAAHICCGNELRGGQVQCYLRSGGRDITPSIYKQSPSFDNANDDRSKMDCLALSELPSGGQLICANAMAAVLALNYVYQIMSGEDMYLGGHGIPCGTIMFDVGLNTFTREDIFSPSLEQLKEYKKRKALMEEVNYANASG